MKMAVPLKVLDRIAYDPVNGTFLWTYDNKSHPRLNGTFAGTERDGYLIIKIDGVAHRAHRIAWVIMTGQQPDIIDHIDGCGLNNRFSNIRNTTQLGNCKNHDKGKNGSGLPCGVRAMPNGRYQARITCDHKVIYLGTYESVDEASAEYLKARKRLFKQFNRGI